MLNFINKLFGSPNKNKLKSYSKTVELINSFEGKINTLSDDQLKSKTLYFKDLLTFRMCEFNNSCKLYISYLIDKSRLSEEGF